jgi:hypothetical protein
MRNEDSRQGDALSSLHERTFLGRALAKHLASLSFPEPLTGWQFLIVSFSVLGNFCK